MKRTILRENAASVRGSAVACQRRKRMMILMRRRTPIGARVALSFGNLQVRPLSQVHGAEIRSAALQAKESLELGSTKGLAPFC